MTRPYCLKCETFHENGKHLTRAEKFMKELEEDEEFDAVTATMKKKPKIKRRHSRFSSIKKKTKKRVIKKRVSKKKKAYRKH